MRKERMNLDTAQRGAAAATLAKRSKRFLGMVGIGFATAGLAATTSYQYDALGRLTEVTHANGNVVTYTLDAAGNRTHVADLLSQSPPASITVPSSSTTGSYSVTWTQGGTVSSYELYESTSSSFSSQTRVYQGSGTSHSISGHTAGTYYYRVRGCAGSACTAYRTGSNGVAVNPGPTAPTGLQKNQNAYCSWSASWNLVAGATSYTIRDSSGNFQYNVPQPTSGSQVFTSYNYCNAPGYNGDSWPYRPKWVKACVGTTCSAQSNFP